MPGTKNESLLKNFPIPSWTPGMYLGNHKILAYHLLWSWRFITFNGLCPFGCLFGDDNKGQGTGHLTQSITDVMNGFAFKSKSVHFKYFVTRMKLAAAFCSTTFDHSSNNDTFALISNRCTLRTLKELKFVKSTNTKISTYSLQNYIKKLAK